MKNVVLLAVLAALPIALVPQATARAARRRNGPGSRQRATSGRDEARAAGITHHRDETWRWQRVMHAHATPYCDSARRSRASRTASGCSDSGSTAPTVARQQAQNPPHRTQWLCIHRYEGSWTDPNSPYYGGLQMDVEFQQTYGLDLYRAKGTADHWTPLEQMWVAERAYRTRGFWPWPNTARYCGLL